MCGRRFGKSLISQIISIEHATSSKTVAYITPTYQLAKVFFDEMIKNLPQDLYECNRSDLVIKFDGGGSIRFFTGERLDAMRGLRFHLVIIDEASYISDLESGWLNSIRPTLTDYQGRAIFLSTPKGRNYFYSLFLKDGEPGWQSFKFTTYDNPHINPAEIDDARALLPTAVFEQEYMANAMENASNPFGSSHLAECVRPISSRPAIAYGIDLAKSVDYTVVVGLDDSGTVCHYERFQKDWNLTKETIRKLPKNVPMLIDSTGNGDPITEDLQKHFGRMTGFKFTSTSKQPLMEGLASAIHQRKVFFPDNYIKTELEIFEFQYTATGVKYGAPTGFHDDCVCALALAWKCYNENRSAGQYYFI